MVLRDTEIRKESIRKTEIAEGVYLSRLCLQTILLISSEISNNEKKGNI